ncbi:MAG: hypothetical protein A2Y93_15250 [Chloroflexi bacterium RBG_13_68_17]|nr:MAG: hypothetical protein A2Y93_15250 [Chloroflexi bacterium RBG_13_68_17]
MPLWNEYRSPVSVEEALASLVQAQGGARIIAGGTDLLLDLQQGRLPPQRALIDVTRIEEMTCINADREVITIGAAVTHAQIVDHPVLQEHAACLVQASALIGGPQVRNVATIGGNVAHALPAGDGSIALLALEAEVEIASSTGRRWEPLEGVFAGPGQVTFERGGELLVAFRFRPTGPAQTSAFRRIMRPQGVAIAILNMAVWLEWETEERIAQVRLTVGAAGPRPLRARQAEAALRGRTLERKTVEAAISALAAEARVRTSPHRASETYRRDLLGVLLAEVLDAARLGAKAGAW